MGRGLRQNTSREVIKEGALNFKIGSSRFVNVTVEVIDI